MADRAKIDFKHRMRLRLLLPLWCALVTGLCGGQEAAQPPSASAWPEVQGDLKNAIHEAQGGNFAYVDQIVKLAGEKDSVPILQNLFTQSPSVETKCFIAKTLIKLGNKDEGYWNWRVDRARDSLDSDIPDPFIYGEDGKAIKGKDSPEFTAWVKAHNETTNPSGAGPIYGPLLPLGMLAGTGDPRAIPLLRRGLLARSYLMEAFSAMGLAELKDKDSIPLIVEACKRAPADAAYAIAMSLLEFHDPLAQAAAEPFLPKDVAHPPHDPMQ